MTTRVRDRKNGEVPTTALQFPPYKLPRGHRISGTVYCAYRRCEVVIGALSDAPIPWFKIHQNGKPFIILCGDLMKAVRCESEGAVAHNWGVSIDTVRKWRRALSVSRMTDGTKRVFRSLLQDRMTSQMKEKALANSRSKSAIAKMVSAKTGQPMHPNTRKSLLEAVKRPKTESHREAISVALKARGIRPPNGRIWEESEDAMLGKKPDREIALETDRSVDAVRRRRKRLQIPRFR